LARSVDFDRKALHVLERVRFGFSDSVARCGNGRHVDRGSAVVRDVVAGGSKLGAGGVLGETETDTDDDQVEGNALVKV
jgi:hypothetical protein